jgi:hypothetical protein
MRRSAVSTSSGTVIIELPQQSSAGRKKYGQAFGLTFPNFRHRNKNESVTTGVE